MDERSTRDFWSEMVDEEDFGVFGVLPHRCVSS